MQVKWLPDPLEDLDQIISYCTEQFGQEVALQFYEKVERNTLRLSQNPCLGVVEPLLSHLLEEYRYVVEGHYKEIYFIESDIIYIPALWDSSHNFVTNRSSACRLCHTFRISA